MAHVGQELGLRPAGGLRNLLRLDELGSPACHLRLESLLVLQEHLVPTLDGRKHLVEPPDQVPDLIFALLFAANPEILLLRNVLHRVGQFHDWPGDQGGETAGEQVRHEEGTQQDQSGDEEVPEHTVPQLLERRPQDHRADMVSIHLDVRHRVDGAEIPIEAFLASEKLENNRFHLAVAAGGRVSERQIPLIDPRGHVTGQDLEVAGYQICGNDRLVFPKGRDRLVGHLLVPEHKRGDAVVPDDGGGRYEILLGILPEGERLVDNVCDHGAGQDDPGGQQDDRHEFSLDGDVPEFLDHLFPPTGSGRFFRGRGASR